MAALVTLLILAGLLATPYYLKHKYFTSEEFLAHKRDIAGIVSEHNEVAHYAAEIRNRGTFQVGSSTTGSSSHLATTTNTSNWNYRRDRNVASYQMKNVHKCSLQVVSNAKADPLKYVMKYFNIKSDEGTLTRVETLGEDIARLEDAVRNLKDREAGIAGRVDPPKFILNFFRKEFMAKVGVELSPIFVPYPEYVFEYVSAGGNSGQKTSLTLTTPTIDALVQRLSETIRWRKSAAGQRALMTAQLRSSIKKRDNYACQQCAVSVVAEPHLLLEVDHKIPVSRGGLSTWENLQTLCWRCNRTKSNRLV